MQEIELMIPTQYADQVFPDPSTLVYYQNLDNRIIWIEGEVTPSISEISKNIILWNMDDDKNHIPPDGRVPIKLYIFTPGGCVDSMLQLVDVIQASKTPVHTVAAGAALSAGFDILIAGHKRFVFPSTTALIHAGSMALEGSFTDSKQAFASYEAKIERCKEYIVNRTTITKDLLDSKWEKDWWLTAEELLQYGCVDKIVESLSEVY